MLNLKHLTKFQCDSRVSTLYLEGFGEDVVERSSGLPIGEEGKGLGGS